MLFHYFTPISLYLKFNNIFSFSANRNACMVIISMVRVGVNPVGMEISAQRRYAPTDIMGKTVKIAVLANLMVQEGMYNLRVCMLLSRDTITIFWNSLISITIIFYLFRKLMNLNNQNETIFFVVAIESLDNVAAIRGGPERIAKNPARLWHSEKNVIALAPVKQVFITAATIRQGSVIVYAVGQVNLVVFIPFWWLQTKRCVCIKDYAVQLRW